MDMGRHQHVSVNRDSALARRLVEQFEEVAPIIIVFEDVAPVVTSVPDMVAETWNKQSTRGHGL
jgi:hypothetical protein